MRCAFIIIWELTAILILTGCNHHAIESKAQSTAAPSSSDLSELPLIAEIFAVEANKFIVGGWYLNAEELEEFIRLLPPETEVVLISMGRDLSLWDTKKMLDKRGLNYRFRSQVQSQVITP